MCWDCAREAQVAVQKQGAAMCIKIIHVAAISGFVRPEGHVWRPVQGFTCSSALSTTEAMFKSTNVRLRAWPGDELIVSSPFPSYILTVLQHPNLPCNTWQKLLLSHRSNNSMHSCQGHWYGYLATESAGRSWDTAPMLEVGHVA